MNQFFSIFNFTYNDAAQPWQLGFQDSAAPGFTGIDTLHETIGFYLILISITVFWVLFNIMYYYNNNKNPIAYKYFTHGSVIEFVWTIIPAVILLAIAGPSFELLYIMDSSKNIKTIQAFGPCLFNYIYKHKNINISIWRITSPGNITMQTRRYAKKSINIDSSCKEIVPFGMYRSSSVGLKLSQDNRNNTYLFF